MKNRFISKLGILQQLWMALFMLIFILTFIFIIFSKRIYTNIIYQQINTASKQNITNFELTMDLIFKQVSPFAVNIANNAYLQSALSEFSGDEIPDDKRMNNILTTLADSINSVKIINIFITKQNKYYSSSTNVYNSPKLINNPSEIFSYFEGIETGKWGIPFWSDTSKEYMFPYYRKLYNNVDGKLVGLIEFQLPMESIFDSAKLNQTSDDGVMMVVDKNGRIYVHKEKNRIMSFIHPDEFDYISSLPINEGVFGKTFFEEKSYYKTLGLYVLNKVSLPEMLEPVKNFVRRMYVLGLIVLIFAAFILYFLTSSITNSLRKMKNTFLSQKNLDQKKYISLGGNKEVSQLANVYNDMIDRIAEASENEKKRQVQIQQYELTLLQQQINPHFLNNILENACGLMELDRTEDSVSLIMDTAQFYRLILSGGDLIIPLSQELSIAETYVKIQNVRYNNKINFEINVPEELMTRKIVKLTLQPLLENAIKYGLIYQKDKWKLIISGHMENNNSYLEIYDNGIGLSQSKFNEVINQKDFSDSKKSIGIYSTNQRLVLYSGKNKGLRLKATEKEGTCIQIPLPEN